MNRRLFPLALSLALLAGCAPAPEPTPEPTPTPAAAVDFHTFLDAVNEKRRAVIEDGEPLDVSDWTPAFADQNTTFTDGEMELLLTPHGPEENLTMEQAREDVETAFTLLRTTYGAYEYFGGDQVFDGLREDALARLEEADPGLPLADVVAEALYTVLSPVVRDGHFAVGRRHLIEPYELNTYYVPGVYIDTPAGLSEDYIKPTIGPDGAITYGFFAMSKDGSDLPDTLGDHELNWALCEPASSYSYSREVFYEGQCQGDPHAGVPAHVRQYAGGRGPAGAVRLLWRGVRRRAPADLRRAGEPRWQRPVVYGVVQGVDRAVCRAPPGRRPEVQPAAPPESDAELSGGVDGHMGCLL